jgi:hypothetical protein
MLKDCTVVETVVDTAFDEAVHNYSSIAQTYFAHFEYPPVSEVGMGSGKGFDTAADMGCIAGKGYTIVVGKGCTEPVEAAGSSLGTGSDMD